MERLPLEWFLEVPVVTRIWTSSIVVTAILEQCGMVSLYKLPYIYRMVFEHNEYWRLITSFIYFGPLSLNLMFSIFFVSKYSRMLEETFYRNKTGEYVWLLLLAMVSLLVIATFQPDLIFLGPCLSIAIIYLWARRNPDVHLSFLGLFVFSAPYFPWVLALLSVVFDQSTLKGQLVGIVVGHFIFFFEDIYPSINGRRVLTPPWAWFRREEVREGEEEQ